MNCGAKPPHQTPYDPAVRYIIGCNEGVAVQLCGRDRAGARDMRQMSARAPAGGCSMAQPWSQGRGLNRGEILLFPVPKPWPCLHKAVGAHRAALCKMDGLPIRCLHCTKPDTEAQTGTIRNFRIRTIGGFGRIRCRRLQRFAEDTVSCRELPEGSGEDNDSP